MLDARQGRALHPDLRPAGVQDRRQVQVLGRADGRGRSAAVPASSTCSPKRRRSNGIEIRYRTRALDLLLRRRPASTGVRVRHDGASQRAARQGGRARLRRLRGQSGMAHALSRPGLGSRQGARHALQHRRRHPHGARRSAPAPCGNWSGCHAVGWEIATRPSSATSRSATSSRSTPIRSASWSTPPASASSTRAPTSATTPMRSTAA